MAKNKRRIRTSNIIVVVRVLCQCKRTVLLHIGPVAKKKQCFCGVTYEA